MRPIHVRLLPLDAASAFRVSAPAALVPVEHFAGTALSEHRFSFYGETHRLDASIDWEANPGTWHWGHDLNRFGFLLLYDLDPSQGTAETLLRLIEDWLDKNGCQPRPLSAHAWQNLLNVAIRIENWWRFLSSATQRGHCDASTDRFQRIAQGVAAQTIALLRMIRARGFDDNWSLIGLRAAFYILCSISVFPKRSTLTALTLNYLRTALSRQILPDGVQQELSPHYHWVALELIVSIRQLAREAHVPNAPWLDATIEKMMAFLQAVMSPSGAIVALGDSDAEYGGRIAEFLDQHVDTERAPSSNASEPDIALFPYAGLACVRHRSTRSLLVFDGGPYGTGHQHEDALSFWLSAFGEDLVVDPGRYLYEKGPDTYYAHLRSTSAHSTIMIDGAGQCAETGRDQWRRSTGGEPNVAIDGADVRLSASYGQGYGPSGIAVRHSRGIVLRENGLSLLIRDELTGEGPHDVEQNWLIAPGPWTLAGRSFRARRGKAIVEISCSEIDQLSCRVAEGERKPYRGWYSPRLNVVLPAPTLIVGGRLTLPVVIETVIRVSPCSDPSDEFAS